VKIADRASVRTAFRLGEIEVPTGLFKTTGETDRPEFTRFLPGEETPDAAEALVGAAKKSAASKGKAARVVKPIPKPDYRRGVKKPDGSLIDVTDQLMEIEEDSKLDAIEIVDFIDRRKGPRERILGSYYLGTASAPRLFADLRKAMQDTSRVAVVRWTKRKGQSLGILTPHPTGALCVLELAFYAETRAPAPECLAHAHAEPAAEEVAGAVDLILAMAGRREDLDSYADRRWQAERELEVRALEGELDDYVLPPAEQPEELVNLERVLRGSVPVG
jgi:non-homologous end joining protein Ku